MLLFLFELTIVVAAIGLVVVVQTLRSVMAFPFQKNSARIVPEPADFPLGTEDLYEQADRELRELGFESPYWVKNEYPDPEAGNVEIQRVYVHRAKRMLAWLAPPISHATPNRLLIYLTTKLIDNRWVISQINDPYFELMDDPALIGKTISSANVSAAVTQHEAHVAEIGVSADRQTTDTQSILDFAGTAQNELRERLLAKGWLREKGNTAHPTLKFSLKMLRVGFTTSQKPGGGENPVPTQRLLHFSSLIEKIEFRAPPTSVQLGLFVITCVAFLIAGAAVFGQIVALSLLIIIVFHELGHWAAMRAFGYKNVHITILPLLGGVTIGHESKPNVAKRAWMYLAGPVPGILLGLAGLVAKYSGAEWAQADWFFILAILMVVINYLNLLPIPPLDGSHAACALFPARWIAIRIMILLIGVVGAVLLSAIFNVWILGIIALLQLFLIKPMLSLRALLRGIWQERGSKIGDRDLSIEKILQVAERTLGPARNVLKRVQLARDVRNITNEPPLGHGQRGLIALVFLGLLIAPGFLVVQAGRPVLSVMNSSSPTGEFEEESLALDISTILKDLSEGKTIPAPADSEVFGKAETRISTALPGDLQRLYRAANGVPALGLNPLDSVRRLGDFPGAQEILQGFVHEGKIQLYLSNGLEPTVDQQEILDWWYLGSGPIGDDLLFWIPIPNDAFGGYQFVHFSDSFGDGYPDVTTWVRETWASKKSTEAYMEEWNLRLSKTSNDLAEADVTEMLGKFPGPPLLWQLMGVMPGWPDGASEHELRLLEERLGQSLPLDHQEALEKHNGFPPADILSAEDIREFSSISPKVSEVMSHIVETSFEAQSPDGAADFKISPDMLSSCWIVGGHKTRLDEGQTSESVTVYPNLLWCPESNLPGSYVTLGKNEFHASFTDVLRQHAINALTSEGW